MAANATVAIFIVSNTFTILFCYISIYRKVSQEKKRLEQILNLDHNQKIARKFIIIIGAYFLAYLPSYLSFVFRLLTGSKVLVELEIFCTFLTMFEPTITISLLFFLNNKYRDSFKGKTVETVATGKSMVHIHE